MNQILNLQIDRGSKISLSEQIVQRVVHAIESGNLKPNARLPSWVDLSVQLGVSRGTVRIAYEKLLDQQFIVASKSIGTRVANRPHLAKLNTTIEPTAFLKKYAHFTTGPAIFQMGVPAQATLPAKLFSRIHNYAIQAELGHSRYPDPRGELKLRNELVAYLAFSRGIKCSTDQIFITNGYASGLGLVLQALKTKNKKVCMENPGYLLTRKGLELTGFEICSIPVDESGIDVPYLLQNHHDASLAMVTAGQQAPLGYALSLERRLALLDWATKQNSWIIEDDYLSELQLDGRATPALASLDHSGHVIHIGSFSKTISPALKLGFIIIPPQLVNHFAEFTTCLVQAPNPAVQLALSEFIREGHYMRHLRKTKRLYMLQRDALFNRLTQHYHLSNISKSGLAIILSLAENCDDFALAEKLFSLGLAPTPLSAWYDPHTPVQKGLLLGVATSPINFLNQASHTLIEMLKMHNNE